MAKLAKSSALHSLLDQMVVSGGSLLVTLLTARVLGIQAFGTYALLQLYVLYAALVQGAMACTPMSTSVPAITDPEKSRTLISQFFSYAICLNLASSLLVGSVAFGLGFWSGHLNVREWVPGLALWAFVYQLQDFCRRALYSHFAHAKVLIADVVSQGGQLLALCIGLKLHGLQLHTVLSIVIASYFISSCLMLAFLRPRFGISAAIAAAREQVGAGMHYLGASQLQWIASSGVLLFGASTAGVGALGAIRAAQNLLGPINVGFQWMENVVPPRISRRIAEIGRSPAAYELLKKIAFGGTLLFAAMFISTALFLGTVFTKLYGTEYGAYRDFLYFVICYHFFGFLYRLIAIRARVENRTALLLRSSAAWAVAGIGSFLSYPTTWDGRQILLSLCTGALIGVAYLAWTSRQQGAHG